MTLEKSERFRALISEEVRCGITFNNKSLLHFHEHPEIP